MIILEGPDNTGKTTLANKLRDEHGYTVVKQDQHSTYEETIDLFTDPSRMGDKLVMDRCTTFSEPVYTAALGRLDRFTTKQYHNMHWALMPHRPRLVHCYEPADRFADREQLPTEAQNQAAAQIYSRFFRVWSQMYPTHMYSWRDSFPVEHLIREDDGAPTWWWNMFLSQYAGCGKLGAPLFVLAESIGPRNTHHIPFEAGPSGVFLTGLVANAPLRVNALFITNFVKGNEDEETNIALLEEELQQNKPRGVLVLGSVAKRAIPSLRYLGFPYRELQHPSYILRSGRDSGAYLTEFTTKAKELIG